MMTLNSVGDRGTFMDARSQAFVPGLTSLGSQPSHAQEQNSQNSPASRQSTGDNCHYCVSGPAHLHHYLGPQAQHSASEERLMLKKVHTADLGRVKPGSTKLRKPSSWLQTAGAFGPSCGRSAMSRVCHLPRGDVEAVAKHF